MRITLVRPPFYNLLGSLKPVYHIGLGYLASAAKKKGHEVSLIDGETIAFEGFNDHEGALSGLKTRFMPSKYLNLGLARLRSVMENPHHPVWETLANKVLSTHPDVIGITCYSQNITAVIFLTRLLKTSLPGAPIVLGGIQPTADPEFTMRHLQSVDYIVIGEGEDTFVELCQVISENKRRFVSRVRGVVYRENNRICFTPPRPLIQDLDRLPFPDRTLENRRYYWNADTIFTSRGCPFKCNFCASHALWTRKVRYRSLDNILAEVDILIKQHDAFRIRIDDDTFTLSKERVLDFCHRVRERGLSNNLSFSLGSRVDTLDEEMIQRLAEISTDTISFGIESGSQKVLEKIGKKITPAHIEKTIGLASAYGIRCLCYFMIGHPEETIDDVKQSIELFDRIANRNVDGELNIVSPYPGTDLWTLAAETDWILAPLEFFKFFHQGDFLVNLTAMTDQELRDYYRTFLRRISKHGTVCKINTIGRMALNGQIKRALRLVLNY